MDAKHDGDWVQSGRELSAQEIRQIRETVTWLPGLARRELAATLCEHLHWYSASGTPRAQACEKLLEKLEAAGLVRLPKKQLHQAQGGAGAGRALSERTRAGAAVNALLGDLEPVRLEPATEPEQVSVCNEYFARYHPLGYRGAFGHRLRYFICSGSQKLGCLLLGGAAKAIALRDRWIGWSDQMRLCNLPWVVNNTRFLVFPWVQVPHLASHVLGQLARRVAADWQRQWGFSPLLLESFVDPRQYAGTCYRAAGWEVLGETSGRGLARPGKHYRSSPRLILVKPLDGDFRALLCAGPLAGGTVQ